MLQQRKGKHATLILYTLHVRMRLLPNQHGFRPSMEQHPPNDGHEAVRPTGEHCFGAVPVGTVTPWPRRLKWPRSPGSEMNSSCGEGFVTLSLFGYVPKFANDPQGITKLFFAMNPSLVSRWAQLFSFLRLILIGPIDCLPQLGLRIDPSPNSPRVPPALCEQNTNFTQKWWLFPFNQGSLG